jgi:hypothetical protein
MAVINSVQLPDGTQYDLQDAVGNYATTTYVDNAVAGITKGTIGLGNVDNTSDLNKPISTATQNALNATNANVANNTNAITGIKKTKVVTVTTTGWTQVTVNSRTLYKKTISLTAIYDVPSVSLCNYDGTPVTSESAEEDYMLLEDVGYDATAKELYLYGSDTPSASYYIFVTSVE